MISLNTLFNFCPRCAASALSIDEEREIRCGACGFRFFFNTAAAAGCFLFRGDELVLGVRAQEPQRGQLDVPGGFIEFGESLEAGIQREVREEMGVSIENLQYLTSAPNHYPFAGVPYRTLDVFFTGNVADGALLTPQDDVAEITFAHPLNLDARQFAFPSTQIAFSQLLKSRFCR